MQVAFIDWLFPAPSHWTLPFLISLIKVNHVNRLEKDLKKKNLLCCIGVHHLIVHLCRNISSASIFDCVCLVFLYFAWQSLRERSLSCKEGVRALALAASQRFAQLDQAKPAEVDKHVAILELLSEKVLAAMEEKDNEAKRARTVRYEYHRDVEQVQSWICQAEGRVQDRNLEPQTLKEFLQVWILRSTTRKKFK